MTWVWEHSEATGNDRLVLLALADCADDSGANAYPSLETLATKARVSRRTAIRCVANLTEDGSIEVIRHGGRKGRGGTSNGYRVLMDAPSSSDDLTPLEERKECQPVTRDKSSLVTNQTEVVTNRVRSGDTGVTRTVEPMNRPEARKARRKPETDAPDEFLITDAMRAWAAKVGVTRNLDAITEAFLDHHRAKGNRWRDWQAAWRKWVRNQAEWHPEPPEAVDSDDPFAGVKFR